MQMNRKIVLIFGVFIFLNLSNVLAQESTNISSKTHAISFKTQFIQIKDAFNYGLKYSGINLVAGYSFSQITDKKIVIYHPEIAFGGVFNKGAGFVWKFKPIDFFYGRKLKSKALTIGAYCSSDYQWQQYPELQGGRLFWFSSIEIGPKIVFEFPYKSYLLDISFSNSIAGIASRPKPSTETYFYAFSFSEFIAVAHQNLQFGSYDVFNRTQLEIELKWDSWKRCSVGYSFEYFGYYNEPMLHFLNHSLNFKWKI